MNKIMIMAVTSKQFALACAGLFVAFAVSLCTYVQAVSNQSPDLRAVLMNPKHELWSRRSPDVFKVRMETSKGTIVIEVRRDWAPRGADRFHNLARAGFFDNSRFFRVRPGFIAQFGIAGDPAIASAWKDQAMPDDPVRQSNTRGSIAYAMTGPNTRTTQLYINLSDNSRLDRDGFAPIGRVVQGMDVADRIYSGYGEDAGGGMRGGKQGMIFEGGNAYLDRQFPDLDKLIRVTVLRER
jgi:cyclophilin family peptidyl-prolyl cis-trans isomerase